LFCGANVVKTLDFIFDLTYKNDIAGRI